MTYVGHELAAYGRPFTEAAHKGHVAVGRGHGAKPGLLVVTPFSVVEITRVVVVPPLAVG